MNHGWKELNIIDMNCYWLIRNSFFVFLFSPFSAFCIYFIFLSGGIFLFVFVSLLLCFLLYICVKFFAFSFLYFSSVLMFCFFLMMLFVIFCVFFSILYAFSKLSKVMLSCAAAIFHSSPTSNTSVETVLIIFNMSTFFLFELLSVWHGYSAIRISLQLSKPNSSNDFIKSIWCLWEFVLFIDKIY